MANILKVKTSDKTKINFFQHIKKSTAQLLSVKRIEHCKLRVLRGPPKGRQQKNTF